MILVDDGSTDNSSTICDEYASRDKRILVIHKENAGQSTARNRGLDIAHGKYIGFVDSDDSLKPEMYHRLYQLLVDNDADISMCELYRFDESDREVVFPSFANEVISDEHILEHYVLPQYKGSYGNPVNKLYKSEIWKQLRFKEGYIHEDTVIIHHVLGMCRRIVTSDEKLYLRLMRSDSTMGISQNRFSLKSYYGHLYALTDLYNYLLQTKRYDLAEVSLRFFAGPLNYAFKRVNYFQYKKELGDLPKNILKKLFFSKNFGNKMRGVKLALLWFSSIFRPFINKEKSI